MAAAGDDAAGAGAPKLQNGNHQSDAYAVVHCATGGPKAPVAPQGVSVKDGGGGGAGGGDGGGSGCSVHKPHAAAPVHVPLARVKLFRQALKPEISTRLPVGKIAGPGRPEALHASPAALVDTAMNCDDGKPAGGDIVGSTPELEQNRQPASQWPAQLVGQAAVCA